jgi:hypothetical protein
MNPQAKSICVASSYTITASLTTHNGKHDPSIFSNMMLYCGVIYVALAGAGDTAERFAGLWTIHKDRAMAIREILVDQPLPQLDAVRQHVVKALSLTRKIGELTDELAFLAAIDDQPEPLHYMAAQWGISLVSVGSLLAASTNMLESETITPESVASIMAYICRYVLTNTRPHEYWVEQLANDPPMLRLARSVSRSLHSNEFGVAVKLMKEALAPARQYLTPLQLYN